MDGIMTATLSAIAQLASSERASHIEAYIAAYLHYTGKSITEIILVETSLGNRIEWRIEPEALEERQDVSSNHGGQ